jgi:hypothetical protein
MPYLQIANITKKKNTPEDLFSTQPNGDEVFLTAVAIHNDDGGFIRMAKLDENLFEYLKSIKIPLPDKK